MLIFCRTKIGADRVAARLKTQKHSVAVMHADRNQSERQEALQGFKAGRYEVLVATDLAARGLDIAGVTHVINYDVPENPEDYVHRIGRTGRAHHLGRRLHAGDRGKRARRAEHRALHRPRHRVEADRRFSVHLLGAVRRARAGRGGSGRSP